MASLVTDLAKTYLEKLINKAIEESRFVCCLGGIAEEYEEEKFRFKAERTTFRQHVEVATRSGDEIQANVRLWEEEADHLISEDNPKTKQKCFYGLCPDCIWQYRMGKELANKTKEIKRLTDKGEKLRNFALPSQLPGVERYSSQHYISFQSRESKYKDILDALNDDNNFIIGLQGMGGTGKTTLAKEVGKELKLSGQFSHVIDTTVSVTPDIKKIQDDIAGTLELKFGENYTNTSDRPRKLWSRLTKGEKILVILDDVWDQGPPLDFDAIGIPKKDNQKGCRVLVTTRSKRVCNNMNCDKVFELDLLSEKEAWIMFKRYAGISSNGTSKSVIEKGRKIANECKRLPVAIAVIASSLKGQQHRLHEWNATLKSLKNPVSMQGVDEDVAAIYKCLKSSYDNMRDEKARGMFLLCSLYREDETFIEYLTRLGIGAGLFGDGYGSYDDARNQVVVATNKLQDSCLLEAGEGYVKMHDLVRDAAKWIKKEVILVVNLSHKDPKSLVEKQINTATKYMLCEGKVIDIFSSRLGSSNLEILIVCFDKDVDRDYVQVEVPNSLFENLVKLRVLHLISKWNSSDKLALSLPPSIQSLTNIRSLLVDGVNLGDIYILVNVQSLETLDLVDCAINELPIEITKLKRFKLLTLVKCEIRRNNPFEVIGECPSLEELYFIDSFNSFCQEITLPKLKRYYIYKELQWNITDEEQSKCVAFKGDGDVGFFSEATFKYCMQTIEVLWLEGINWVWRNLIPEIVPIDQGMNDLVELGLNGISQLKCLIDTFGFHEPNVFSKLVVLELHAMQNLQELCNGPLSFDSLKSLEKLNIEKCNYLQSLAKCKLNLCNLKSIEITECPMLASLFPWSTSQSLVLLEELSISDCERLESIIIIDHERRDDGDGDNTNKSHGSMFQKLKLLAIHGCPMLECMFPILSAGDLPALETIDINRCDGLKYIFSQDLKLGSLREISLCQLTNFIDIFPKYYLPMSSSPMKGSSSTSRDCSKCNNFSWAYICCYVHKNKHKVRTTASTKLPIISQDPLHECSITLESNSYRHTCERAQCLPIQPRILCNMKVIELSHFSKIKSVFVLSICPRMMLESLTIMDCDELNHIIVDTSGDNGGNNNWGDVFPKLKELHVKNCEKLEYIFGHDSFYHQNDNEMVRLHLPVLKCLTLSKLPSFLAMCPKNYRTIFPPLRELHLNECSQFSIKSIGDFISQLVPRSLDITTIKELSGSMEQLCALERLQVDNTKVENIFCLDEKNGQQKKLELQNIELHHLPMMTYLFIGPKNSFTLQNLIKMNIVRCEKVEIMFFSSIIRCLPRLLELRIEECKELKHIVEDDEKMSNSQSPRVFFAKLKALVVVKCNKLKYLFPMSICKRLHELKVLLIREAYELEEILRSKGDYKVEIPNLKIVVFDNLPNLRQTQGIQLQDVENHFLHNCQKLALTSASTQSFYQYIIDSDIDWDVQTELWGLFEQLQEDSRTQGTSDGIRSPKTIEDIVLTADVGSISELTSSQELLKGQSTGQQYPLEETGPTVKASQGNIISLEEIEGQSIPESAASEQAVTTILFNNSKTKNEPSTQSPEQKAVGNGVKEHVDTRDTSKTTETHDQGNPSQIMGDLRFSSLIKRELEQILKTCLC